MSSRSFGRRGTLGPVAVGLAGTARFVGGADALLATGSSPLILRIIRGCGRPLEAGIGTARELRRSGLTGTTVAGLSGPFVGEQQ